VVNWTRVSCAPSSAGRRPGETIVPCITHTIRRFGDGVLDLSPPQALPVTTLNLAPGALFPAPATASGPPPDGFSGR